MPSILPTKPVAPTRKYPKIIVTYGMPKVGKTTALTQLPSCLIEDMEEGAASIEAMRVPVKYIEGPTTFGPHPETGEKTITAIAFNQIMREIGVYAQEWITAHPSDIASGKKVPYLYRRIALDTMDRFEDLCLPVALDQYKSTTIGKNFDGNDIRQLAKGLGYYYLRDVVKSKIEELSGYCETLILNCHTKEKITEIGGVEFTSTDLSLTGKLGAIIAAMADVIIYLYRVPGKPLMGSLKTVKDGGVMGARSFAYLDHLIGTEFEFSWDKILPETIKPA